jgi:26S proteasome regulatory subunit N1
MPGKEEEKDEKIAVSVETTTEDKKEKDDVKINQRLKIIKKDNPDEMSEEDKNLKEGLDLAVSRLMEKDPSMHQQALDHLVNEIRSSTASMTSVPKPLKFLRGHYAPLKSLYESWDNNYSLKVHLADVLSVLAMTMAEPSSRESLKFKLKGS